MECKPINFLKKHKQSYHINQNYVVQINAVITPCPKAWKKNNNCPIIYKITKPSHYMTPHAHFYGKIAYGMILESFTHPETKKQSLKIKKTNDKETIFERSNFYFYLTQSNGNSLPAFSEQLYDSQNLIQIPVDYGTFQTLLINEDVIMEPNLDMVCMNTMPKEKWIYHKSDLQTLKCVESIAIHITSMHRDVTFESGETFKYVCQGNLLIPKVIIPAIYINAGKQSSTIKQKSEMCEPKGTNQKLLVTSLKLKPHHVFLINKTPMKILTQTSEGYIAVEYMQ